MAKKSDFNDLNQLIIFKIINMYIIKISYSNNIELKIMYTTIETPEMFSSHVLEIGDIIKVIHISECFVNVQKICDFTSQIS